MQRLTIDVDGVATSYLSAGDPADPVVLMIHGTFWSRVWQPVLDDVAAAGLYCVAVDLPGLGHSDGELTVETASVPALAGWVERFADALGIAGPVGVAAHDIGGGIAQHLMVHGNIGVSHLALLNAVMYDSWPVPAVARYRDPAVAAATTHEELVAARRIAITRCLDRAATPVRVEEYLAPWLQARVARNWIALAAAADNRYTQALVPALRESQIPKLLIWGEDDPFQQVEHAERFAREMPHARLVRIPHACHFPAENDPEAVAKALREFFRP
ncbi:alpha/beta hydrolase (plasmid) [Cupriavidus sp. P-10]|uniref:alpha/beta fold hydrolase n=1 Tax=Cupriavidus sp. P-10 TaxID=2027911 RepID=UPI000E2E53B8|nr:alpha/beta hydrolase [Cupriavidus sp. P-10]BDB29772.1 alpha/beta hydrolase [Cupriavidus sp. P-10]